MINFSHFTLHTFFNKKSARANIESSGAKLSEELLCKHRQLPIFCAYKVKGSKKC